MKIRIDWTSATAALRTAGALMVGNTFVAPFVLGNRNWPALVALLTTGLALIIITSMSRRS